VNAPFTGTFSGAILTGGNSTRMGRDKAFVEVSGRPMVTIPADALLGAGATDVVCVGGDDHGLARLGLRVVPDDHPGSGPLGGLLTALRTGAEPVVVVLACDLPAVTPAAVRCVLDGLGDGDAALPDVDGRTQTLLAAYRRSALDPLRAAFDAGERAPRRALAGLDVRRVTFPDPRWARNANHPEDVDPF
jgi:molybdopterin-guanine dinucleotide biosynthesis protein A